MSEGRKDDQEKIPVHLFPPGVILDISEVLGFGARKYAPRNWEGGIAYSRVYGALQRHMLAWWGGEDTDPETGLSHLAHAGCCITFLLEFLRTHPELDDRPGRGKE